MKKQKKQKREDKERRKIKKYLEDAKINFERFLGTPDEQFIGKEEDVEVIEQVKEPEQTHFLSDLENGILCAILYE